MATITSLSAMTDYCKLRLGMPVIQVELTDAQFTQIIEDCVDIFSRYLYGDDGTYLDRAIITVSAGQWEVPLSSTYDYSRGYTVSAGTSAAYTAYPLVNNIEAIYEFGVSFGMDGINTLFSPTHVLLYDQFVNKGQYPGGPGTGLGMYGPDTGFILTNYQISMMYVEEINNMFGKYYTAKWLPGRQVIQIVPTPASTVTAVLSFYRRSAAENIYNHPLFKRLALAKCKEQWGGLDIGKYAATLPDGMTINYSEIYQQGKDELTEVLTDIRAESEPVNFFIA